MALITLLAVTSINLRKVVDMFFTKASHSFYSFFPNTTTRDSEHKKKEKRKNVLILNISFLRQDYFSILNHTFRLLKMVGFD